LLLLGRDSAAAATYRRCLAIDPARAITLDELSLIDLLHHRYREARELEDSALALDTTAFWVLNDRAHIQLLLGDFGAARADAEAARRLGPSGYTYWGEAVLAILAAREGDTATARATAGRLAREITEPGRPTVQEGRWIGAALLAAGEPDSALAFLWSIPPERRGAELGLFLRFPELDPLRGSPRFQRLMAETRPPDAAGR